MLIIVASDIADIALTAILSRLPQRLERLNPRREPVDGDRASRDEADADRGGGTVGKDTAEVTRTRTRGHRSQIVQAKPTPFSSPGISMSVKTVPVAALIFMITRASAALQRA